jgi:hypothetical protein
MLERLLIVRNRQLGCPYTTPTEAFGCRGLVTERCSFCLLHEIEEMLHRER